MSAAVERPEPAASAGPASSGTAQGTTDAGCALHGATLYDHAALADSARALPTEGELAASTAAFERDGLLVFTEAFSAEQVAAQNEALQSLVDGSNAKFSVDFSAAAAGGTPDFTSGAKIPWVQYEAGTQVDGAVLRPELSDRARKVMGFVGYSAAIDAAVCDERILSLVATLLRCSVAELELFQDMALLKPPGGGREKPWHQDKAYFNVGIDTPVIGCWIAVDEATCDNGCMRMLRGGHKAGPKMHFPRRDYQICDDDAPAAASGDDIVACPLPPGGLVIFDGMLPHGTPVNATQDRRRALQFHWIKRGAAPVGPDDNGGRVEVYGGVANGLTC